LHAVVGLTSLGIHLDTTIIGVTLASVLPLLVATTPSTLVELLLLSARGAIFERESNFCFA
jgi:hypothetical protein